MNNDKNENSFTAAAIASALGVTQRQVRRRAARESWDYTEEPVSGGRRRLYALIVLPTAAQAAIATTVIRHNGHPVLAPAPAEDARAEALAAIFEAKPEKSKQRARGDLAIVQEYQRLKAGGYKEKAARAAVSGKHQVHGSTVWSLWRDIRQEPPHLWLYLLVDRYPGRTKCAEMSAEAWEALKGDYLRRERPTAKACIERVTRANREQGSNWKLPSPRTMARRLAKIPRIVQVVNREGPTAAKQLYPAQQRLKQALAAIEIVNGDGYKHNVWVRFPDGEVRRAQTWFWQDVYSSKILNWRTDKTEHTDVIRLSFGDLVEAWGIPEAVVIDNTLAAANKTMTGGVKSRFRFKIRDDEPLGVFPLLGVRVHWATPAHGQAKPVERTYGIGGIGEYVDKAPELAGAWTGSNTLDKPEYDGKHRAIELVDLEKVIAREVAAWNAREGRRGAMQQGRSCDAVFEESYSRAAIRRATEAQRRLWLLATEPVICASRDGSITLGAGRIAGERVANRYWSTDMADLAGRQVVARFDPQRLHQGVHIYTLDGRYVCFAECVKPAAFNDANAAREHNRARKTFLRSARDMADAESRMSVLDAAKAYAAGGPSTIPPPPAPRSKVIRGEFRDPLERQLREAAPDSPEDAEWRESFNRETASASQDRRARVIAIDDPDVNYRRWNSLDRRLKAGEPVSDEDRAWHAAYRGSDEWRSMEAMAQDFPQLKEA